MLEKQVLGELGIEYSEGIVYIEKLRDIDYPTIIKVGGECLEGENFKYVANDLKTLSKLKIPIILNIGAGPQIDKALPHSKKINGIDIQQKSMLK